MNQQTVARAGAVALVALAMLAASQVLARIEPDVAPSRLEASGPTTTIAAAGATTTALPPATSTTAPLPPITGPVRLDERSELDGRGIGPVEAGMTVAEAEQSAGRRFTITDRPDVGARCYGAVPDGLVGLRLAVQGPADDPREGRIVRVEATGSTWATVSDARVGSSIEEVKRLYGSRAKASADGKALTVSVKDGGRSFAVAFMTSERGVVTEIRSGEAAAVERPVACA